MATLNEIAYNIKELMSGGNETKEQQISTRQIKHWVHYHRAKIIEEKLLSGAPIDRRWIQPITTVRTLYNNNFDLVGNLSYTNNSSGTYTTKAFSNTEYYGKDYADGKEFNTYAKTIEIPHTINIAQNDGLTDVRLKKRINGDNGTGRYSSWAKIPIKTKDEAMFGWANKFTNITTPYVVPYNNIDAGMNLEVNGLRYFPVDNDNSNYFEYVIDIWGILTNPTLSRELIMIGGAGESYNEFIDATSYYPMSEEDLPLLISRVAEVEMTLLLKTPLDLIEDNTNTPKINIGQPEK
jgi:hypothetical protein